MKEKCATIKLFASLKDSIGKDTLEWPIEHEEGEKISEVFKKLQSDYEFAHNQEDLLVALNENFVQFEDFVFAGDTLALLPPVAGG